MWHAKEEILRTKIFPHVSIVSQLSAASPGKNITGKDTQIFTLPAPSLA